MPRRTFSWTRRLRLLLSALLLALLVLLAACAPPPPHTMIYAVSQMGTVYAVSGMDGSIRWSHHMSGDNDSPWGAAGGFILDHGIIYTSSSVSGGYVYAFEAQTGAVLWHTQVHPQGLPSTPTLANGVIYVSVTDTSLTSSHVSAFKATDSSLLWRVQIKGCGTPPVVAGQSLYLNAGPCTGVGPRNGAVYALNADNGSVRWRASVANIMGYEPLVLNGVVYSDGGNTLVALRAADGSLLWRKQFVLDDRAPLVGVGKTLYLGGGSSLTAVRASDGKQLWQVHVGDHGWYDPTVIGNTVYVVSFFESELYAFRAQDGTSLWSYQTQASSAGSFPVGMDNIIYSSSLDGTIYELAAADGTLIAKYALPDATLFTHVPLAVGP